MASGGSRLSLVVLVSAHTFWRPKENNKGPVGLPEAFFLPQLTFIILMRTAPEAVSRLWGRADWCPKHFHTVCLGGTHIMYLGGFSGLLGPPEAPFGAPEVHGGSRGTKFGPKCQRLVQLGESHPHQVLWPLKRPLLHSWGPQRGPYWPQEALLGAPGVLGQPQGA